MPATALTLESMIGAAPRGVIQVGLIGRGVQKSRTPAMHEAEGAALGIDYRYRLIDAELMGEPVPALAKIVEAAEAAGYAGLNVTYPYKREILPLLDGQAGSVQAVGAVNTLVFQGGRRIGHNTDYYGFAESFRRGLAGAACNVVLLIGAGGAGGAVANALLDNGVGRLLIFDVAPKTAQKLVATLGERLGPDRAEICTALEQGAGAADGIVNATPVGMAKLPGLPLPLELIAPRHWVADIVYFPLETALLAAARKKGCRLLPGSGMAVFQAARAFALFSGKTPDPMRMRAVFDSLGD